MTTVTRWMVVLAVTAVGCGDKGSLGNYDEGGTESGDGSTSDDPSASASMSSSASTSASSSASETASATGETSDTDPSMSTSANPTMTGGETDGPVCETEGNCTVYPAPCGDNCGALESEFDEAGCLRQKCGDDDQCGDGERCFVALEFGLCESSGTFCADDPESESCSCGGDADCNGGHCVPEELYPVEMPGPEGDMLVTPDCAPDDGSAFVLGIWVAGEAQACDPSPDAERLLSLIVYEQLAVGTFEIGPSSGAGVGTSYIDGEEEVGSATIEITELGETVSGHYTITLGGYESEIRVLGGDFVDVPSCPQLGNCG